ncbi:3421_t:CDS:2, partial [Dentiscutata erythropus]
TASENAELKARVAKLEQKQLQTDEEKSNHIILRSNGRASSADAPASKSDDDTREIRPKGAQDDGTDKNQIVEQGLIEELGISTEKQGLTTLGSPFGPNSAIDNTSSTEINTSENKEVSTITTLFIPLSPISNSDKTSEEFKSLSETEVSIPTEPSHTSSHSVTAFGNSEDAINEDVKSLPETE